MLNKSFAFGVNIIDHWNNHWTIFGETSISNTLSTLKFLWNFPFRPERKIILGRKNSRPQLSSLNYIYTSVEAPFRYRMILTRIGRSRNVTICDFRHVPILSVKNVMLSKQMQINFDKKSIQRRFRHTWLISSIYLLIIWGLWFFARILQDNRSSCKILQDKHSSCKILQDNHFLQDSCKILQDNHLVSTRVATVEARAPQVFWGLFVQH